MLGYVWFHVPLAYESCETRSISLPSGQLGGTPCSLIESLGKALLYRSWAQVRHSATLGARPSRPLAGGRDGRAPRNRNNALAASSSITNERRKAWRLCKARLVDVAKTIAVT
jgi:hypothetical protein